MPLDDPTELFDLCDSVGRPLGRTKSRELVHRDGDWHRSVHLWVVLTSPPRPTVVFQRRSLTKDSHPGKVDVSVAGHRRAGEGGGAIEAVLREAHEEAGLSLEPSDLTHVGARWHVSEGTPGHVDREIQDVFLATLPRTLETLRPDPDEVAGLIATPLAAALAITQGEAASVSAMEIRPGDADPHAVTLRVDELVPSTDDYFAFALRSLERRLRGVNDPPWVLRLVETG